MTVILVALFATLGLVGQSQLPSPAFLAHAKWPFLPALVLYFALNRDFDVAVGVALVVGLIQDALGSAPLGLSMLSFAFIAMIAGRFRTVVVPDSVLTTSVFGMLACAFWTVVNYAVLRVHGWCWPFPRLLCVLTGTTVLGGAATPLFHRLIGWVDRVVVKRDHADLLNEIY